MGVFRGRGPFMVNEGWSSEEVPLNWNKWIRQAHRWLSIAFTVSVIVTFIALSQENPVIWVSYVPLLPLALLLVTGLYLFVLPYATRRTGRGTGAAGSTAPGSIP